MLGLRFVALAALSLAVAGAACRERAAGGAPAAPASGSAPAAAAPPAASASGSGVDDETETKKRRFPEPMTYVDGEAVAGLRYLELPQRLKPRFVRTTDEPKIPPARRYSVADYIESLGIDIEAVKQVHFIGGKNRHSIVDGPEIIRTRDSLMFSFTQGTRGKPRMHYPSDGMAVNTQVDILGTIAVYARREPPRYEPRRKYTYFEAGEPIQGIPYASDERTGGTRVYVDGELTTAIKRKTLPSSAAIEGTPEQGLTRFSLEAYLDQIGIGAEQIQGMELTSGDDLAAAFDARALAEKIPGLVFTLPRRSRGRIQVADLPEETSKIDAILLYAKSALPDRVAQGATPGSPVPQVKRTSATTRP
ncbi:MAG: hypothetical protein IT372_34595 [Polyangiaceae bacterium]|nr:hypothetical protein [Polyangiaceae bacterium]